MHRLCSAHHRLFNCETLRGGDHERIRELEARNDESYYARAMQARAEKAEARVKELEPWAQLGRDNFDSDPERPPRKGEECGG